MSVITNDIIYGTNQLQVKWYTRGKRVCFRVTTQMYSKIHVFALGPGTHTLLHTWLELRVAITLYINNFHTFKANGHRNYSQWLWL